MKRIVDWGADAVKILIYYTPFEEPSINDIKHAFIERIGAECETYEIPFFLEFVGYDPKGGDEKGLEYAKAKPEIVKKSMEEFSKPQYRVDVLKVEVPINAEFVEGRAYTRVRRPTPGGGARALPRSRRGGPQAVYLSERRREQRAIHGIAAHGGGSGHGLFRRALRPRHLEGRHPGVRQARGEGAGRLAAKEGVKNIEAVNEAISGEALVRQDGRGSDPVAARARQAPVVRFTEASPPAPATQISEEQKW